MALVIRIFSSLGLLNISLNYPPPPKNHLILFNLKTMAELPSTPRSELLFKGKLPDPIDGEIDETTHEIKTPKEILAYTGRMDKEKPQIDDISHEIEKKVKEV